MDVWVDKEGIRRRNLDSVRELGTGVNAGLPVIDTTRMRGPQEIIDRSLVVLALFNLSLDAPIDAIREWIKGNGLSDALSPSERSLLNKTDEDLTEQEIIDLSWSVETLYALMWVGGLVSDLRPETRLPSISHLSPSIEAGEDGSMFSERMRLRPYEEVYAARDLFYTAHWSARADRLASVTDGPLDEGVVSERRKALEWAMDDEMDWDDVTIDT